MASPALTTTVSGGGRRALRASGPRSHGKASCGRSTFSSSSSVPGIGGGGAADQRTVLAGDDSSTGTRAPFFFSPASFPFPSYLAALHFRRCSLQPSLGGRRWNSFCPRRQKWTFCFFVFVFFRRRKERVGKKSEFFFLPFSFQGRKQKKVKKIQPHLVVVPVPRGGRARPADPHIDGVRGWKRRRRRRRRRKRSGGDALLFRKRPLCPRQAARDGAAVEQRGKLLRRRVVLPLRVANDAGGRRRRG